MENLETRINNTTEANTPLLNRWVLVTCLISFVLGYLSFFTRPIYYLEIVLLTAITYIVFIEQIRRTHRVPWVNILLSFTFFFCVILGLVYYKFFFQNYIFLLFLPAAFALIKAYYAGDRVGLFFRTYNLVFIIYLFLSLMVYLDILPIGRTKNIFELEFLGRRLNTLIGLFGSTASIDAYAAVTLLINLFFYKGKYRRFFIVASFLAAFFTFRASPYLVIFGALSIYYIRKVIKTPLTDFLGLCAIFLLFVTPVFVKMFFGQTGLLLFDLFLTGRASLWLEMLNIYQSSDILEKLIGFGVTDRFEVMPWGHLTTNPHNTFFNILLLYGAPVFIMCFCFVYYVFRRLDDRYAMLFVGVLLAGVGNSLLFSFMSLPLVFTFLICCTQLDTHAGEGS